MNYESESVSVINSIINNRGDIGELFNAFTIQFTAYSKTTNPKFGLIYVLDFANKLYIGNYLDQPIIVDCDGCEPQELIGCYDVVNADIQFEGLSFSTVLDQGLINDCTTTIDGNIDEISTIIDGLNYIFDIVEGKPQIIIVSKEYVGELSKVFTKGEFEKGEKPKTLSFSEYCSSIIDPERCKTFCIWEGDQCRLKSCSAYTYRNGCQEDAKCCWQQLGGESFVGECRDAGTCN
jgi:hypothetical protein